MAKKPAARPVYAFFNVLYEDGSQRSNRKVNGTCDGVEGEADALEQIAAQDREIADKSGVPPLAITSVSRVRR